MVHNETQQMSKGTCFNVRR